jgi:hypothetical protein
MMENFSRWQDAKALQVQFDLRNVIEYKSANIEQISTSEFRYFDELGTAKLLEATTTASDSSGNSGSSSSSSNNKMKVGVSGRLNIQVVASCQEAKAKKEVMKPDP